MSEFNGLPFEIIDQILKEFVEQLDKESQGDDVITASEPVLKTSSYTELIRLRLISKTWSRAVIPCYFQTISIPNSKRAKIILDNWNVDLFRPYFQCPVQRLTIEEPWNPPEDGFPKDAQKTSPSMSQLASIIRLLGSNLKTLDIDLISCLRLSPDFIEAIKTIIGLKSLKISFNYVRRAHRMYDPDSLLELISAIPTLENLSLESCSFGHLNFKSPALSNLRYFCFGNDENLDGISSIIEKSKNTLKFIELDAWFERREGLQKVFEPVKDTLEGLFTSIFTSQVTKSVKDLTFPKLRVIRTACFDDITSEIDWLQAPMLKNVRTIVSESVMTESYWGDALRAAGVNALKKVPNFKHIVCTYNPVESEYREDFDHIHPDLFKLFKSHGVQCHVTPDLTSDEIMDLDLQLNGPM